MSDSFLSSSSPFLLLVYLGLRFVSNLRMEKNQYLNHDYQYPSFIGNERRARKISSVREKDRDCMHVREEQRCTKKLKNECRYVMQRYNVSI